MRIENRYIKSFAATDEMGNRFTLHIFRQFRHTATEVVEGTSSIKTQSGQPVNRVGKGEYKLLGVIGPDIVLRSDDPDAP